MMNHHKHLLVEKYLSEFKTDHEKNKACLNLGISDLQHPSWDILEGTPYNNVELKNMFIDFKVLLEHKIAESQELCMQYITNLTEELREAKDEIEILKNKLENYDSIGRSLT